MGDLPLDLGERHGRGGGELGDDELLGLLHHFLLPEGEGLEPAEIIEAFENRHHIQNGAGFHQVDVFFIAALPVHGDFDLAVLHEIEDLLDRAFGDQLADAHFLGHRPHHHLLSRQWRDRGRL